ncbi:lysophospholipid acyltransferase family protein [Verrucomicrobiota bacterium]
MKIHFEEIKRYIRGKLGPAPVRFLIWLIPKMSRPKLLALGRHLGMMMYYLSRAHRRRALHNLDIVFGNRKSSREKKHIAQAGFQNFTKSAIELIMFDSVPVSTLRDLIKIEGRANLDKAFEVGKGVIGLTAHFGNFFALHKRLCVEGYTINCVIKAMRDKGVEEIVHRIRTEQGMKTIYVSPTTRCVKACREALAGNEILVLLNDQAQKRGVEVEFFGAPVWTAAGPATLALTTGAAVVPMFILRNPDDSHTLMIDEAVEVVRTGDKQKDILLNTQAFTKITESYVSRYPEQWAWNQRRWRRT